MKLSTIWTISAMSFPERLRRTRDWFAMEVAARLPKRIRFWATIIEIGKATQHSPNIPDTTLEEILDNLDAPKVVS